MLVSGKEGKKKFHKARIKGFETKKQLTGLLYGTLGLKVRENGRVTVRQIETLRRGLTKALKKNFGQLWFRHSLAYAITKKPTEIRMGKGKGSIFTHVIRIRAGSLLCELDGYEPDSLMQLLKVVSKKLGLLSSILTERRYF